MTSKRIFDLTLVLLGAVPAAVVVVVCALAIRATSPGPAIFRQVRLGRDENRFICLKLRTMTIDTASGPTHKIGAANVTSLGRYLRRLKLDELPQLWNIFFGDMSFVGPRPGLPDQTELTSARRKHGLYAIRPGMTGVSQIAGVDMSEPEKLAALDATYLQDVSLARDIKLMIATMTRIGRG